MGFFSSKPSKEDIALEYSKLLTQLKTEARLPAFKDGEMPSKEQSAALNKVGDRASSTIKKKYKLSEKEWNKIVMLSLTKYRG